MSYQPELEKSADPSAQYPSQPPAYQTEPPQGQYPPPGQYPPTAQYDQQQATVTVVTAQPATRYVVNQTTAPDYLNVTLIGMLVCCFCGGVLGMILLVPALICSLMASNANKSQDYDTARKLGKASLAWNIIAYILNALAIIVTVVVAVVVVQLSSRVTCRVNQIGNTVCS